MNDEIAGVVYTDEELDALKVLRDLRSTHKKGLKSGNPARRRLAEKYLEGIAIEVRKIHFGAELRTKIAEVTSDPAV